MRIKRIRSSSPRICVAAVPWLMLLLRCQHQQRAIAFSTKGAPLTSVVGPRGTRTTAGAAAAAARRSSGASFASHQVAMSTRLFAVDSRPGGGGNNSRPSGGQIAAVGERREDQRLAQQQSQRQQIALGWFAPWILAALSFFFYEKIAVAFRTAVDHAAHYTWVTADKGVYEAELILPALNGPVVTSISILFATLSAITISSLYTRQDTLHRTLIAMVEDVLHLQLLVDAFPESHKTQAKQILGTFAEHIYDLCIHGELCPKAIRKEHLGALVSLVNQMGVASSQQQGQQPVVRDAVLKETYESVVRINVHRARLSSALSATFPVFHYLNLVGLALAICLIFLLETDLDVVLFLAGFQLGICWSLLVGTFSMLAMVCYDMSNPFSGIFQVRYLLPLVSKTHRGGKPHILTHQARLLTLYYVDN